MPARGGRSRVAALPGATCQRLPLWTSPGIPAAQPADPLDSLSERVLNSTTCSPTSNLVAPSWYSPLTRELSGGMSEGVLTEMRSRLIAGLKRYFHGKRMEGLLSVQVRGVGGVGPAVGRRQPDDGGRCNTAFIPCPRVLGCVHSTAPAPFPPPHHSDLLATTASTEQGLRILEYACDHAAEHTSTPLGMWTLLEREVQVRGAASVAELSI